MSDSNLTPGEHPAFPPMPPTDPNAASPQFSPPPAQQYPPAQQQYPVAPQYGSSAQYPGVPPYAPPRPSSGLAVTALIAGIAGIVLSWTFVALLGSIAAVITGHMALNQIRRNPALGGRGMAIAGLILGYVGVAILAFTVVIAIFSFLFIGGVSFLPFFLS